MKFKSRNIIAYLLCFTFLFSFIALPYAPVADATVYEDLIRAGEELSRKIAENKNKLAALRSNKNNQEEYLKTLQTNIDYTQSQLDNLNSQISVIEAQIKDVETTVGGLEKEIKKLNNDIESTDEKIKNDEKTVKETYKKLSARLRTAYVSGSDSNLKLLLGSENVTTFLRRLELMRIVSENDKNLINDLKAEAEILELSKSSLRERTSMLDEKKKAIKEENEHLYEKRSELETKKASLDSTNRSLESQYSEVQATIANLDKNSAYYQNLILKQEQEEEENEKAIEAYIAAHASRGNGGSGNIPDSSNQFMCPIQFSGAHVTSYFGWRTLYGKPNNHGGIDISAPNIYGQNIYAARAGTVLKAEYYSNTGYGHYVILDHGDGYSTVYGHCSTVLVSEGQYVNKGDVIAKVGSTGNSTGPHLHFEIRYNSVKQNPLNYVKVS